MTTSDPYRQPDATDATDDLAPPVDAAEDDPGVGGPLPATLPRAEGAEHPEGGDGVGTDPP